MSTHPDAFGPDDEASHNQAEPEHQAEPDYHEPTAPHARVPWPITSPPAGAAPHEESRFSGDETSVLDLSTLTPAAREAIETARAQRNSPAGQPRPFDPSQSPQAFSQGPAQSPQGPPQKPRHVAPPQMQDHSLSAQQPAGQPQPPSRPPHPGNPQRPQFRRPDPAGGRRRGFDSGFDAEERTTDLQPDAVPGLRPPPRPNGGSDNFFEEPAGTDDVADPWGSVPEPAPARRHEDFSRTTAGRDGFGARAGTGAVERVTSTRRRPPATGWRRMVSKMTFGRITPGPSAKQEAYAELIQLIKSPLADTYTVAFVNAKGGVGKTTMTVGAGCAIAGIRGDRVIAVDMDPDLGNLSSRFNQKGGPKANIEALASLKDPSAYPTVRTYTVQNDDDLEMLGSQNDPRVSYTLNSQDFETTMRILRLHYNVVLLDCGTAITSPLFSAIAQQVDALVIVASQDAPGLNGAWSTLTWLSSHGFSALLPRTTVAVNAPFKGKALVDVDASEDLFRELVPGVKMIRVPYDVHLAEGGDVVFKELKTRTRRALTELAGAIAEHYPVRGQRRTTDTGGF